MKDYERIFLMLTIARRGFRAQIIDSLRELDVTYNMVAVGESHGGLTLREYLGLQDDELDIVFSVVGDSKVEHALALIEYGHYKGAGEERAVAILMPINGVSGPLALEFISGPGKGHKKNSQSESVKEKKVMNGVNRTNYNLIVAIVNKGYADMVIEAAKGAGARGGTVIYVRGSGIHETEKFMDIPIEPEKELVLTLVKSEKTKETISAITEKAGLTKPGGGISFVLPVIGTAGFVTKLPSDEEPTPSEKTEHPGEKDS